MKQYVKVIYTGAYNIIHFKIGEIILEQPKVCVIIPTYKRSDRLSRAIDSVLQQTYENIEVIVVDDNNPNTQYRKDTEHLMSKYQKKSNVKYIKHSKNKNGAAARNTGIKYSDCKYIAFLDDDDEFLPDKIKNQVNKMESLDGSWGACYTAYKKLNINNKTQQSAEKREGKLLTEALMRNLYIVAGSNLMVRKTVVEEINGFDESFERNQDLEFLVRILEKYKLAYVDSCSLIIHYEVREIHRTYDELKQVDKQYISKFRTKIEKLNNLDKKKVFSMIALDNFRNSLSEKKLVDGIRVLIVNKVSLFTFLKYIIYLSHRYISKTSYGFKI